jgi:hypothetical protein
MAEPRQPVERQHADRGKQRREQHRQLESDHGKGGKRIERSSADVDRIVEIGEELHSECEREPENAAEQSEPQHAIIAQPQHAVELGHRKRRERIEAAITFRARLAGRRDQRLGRLEFGKQAERLRHGQAPHALRAAPP